MCLLLLATTAVSALEQIQIDGIIRVDSTSTSDALIEKTSNGKLSVLGNIDNMSVNVTGGELNFNGAHSNSSFLSVTDSTLSGNFTLNGNLNMTNSSLNIGNSIGTATLSGDSNRFVSNSKIIFEIGNNISDQILFSGDFIGSTNNLAVSDNTVLNIFQFGGLSVGDTFVLMDWSNASSFNQSLDLTSNNPDFSLLFNESFLDGTLNLTATGLELEITSVPETKHFALLLSIFGVTLILLKRYFY